MRQRQALVFVADFIQRRGYSPSYKEIGAAMGVSSSATVHKYVKALERTGKLVTTKYGIRSLEIPKGVKVLPQRSARDCKNCHLLRQEIADRDGIIRGLMELRDGKVKSFTEVQELCREKY